MVFFCRFYIFFITALILQVTEAACPEDATAVLEARPSTPWFSLVHGRCESLPNVSCVTLRCSYFTEVWDDQAISTQAPCRAAFLQSSIFLETIKRHLHFVLVDD